MQQCEATYTDDEVACSAPAVVTIDSTTPGGTTHLCAKHAPMCEADITVDDNDAGGPYHFEPCTHRATKIITWTTDFGQDITVGLCAFHATGEI